MKEHIHINMNMIHIPSFLSTVSTLCFFFTLPQSHSQENGTKFWNCRSPFYFSVRGLYSWNISYPFWDNSDRPRYCGGRNEFQISASHGLIGIELLIVSVVNINITTNTMIIVHRGFDSNECEDILIHNTFSPTVFHYTENVYNNTVFRYCPGDVSFRNNFTCTTNYGLESEYVFYVQDTELNQFPERLKCKDHIQQQALRSSPLKPGGGIDAFKEAMRGGFEVKYVTEEKCKRCRDSKGICGRIDIEEYRFSCHCPDGSETSSLCLHHTNKTLTIAANKWNKKRKVILGNKWNRKKKVILGVTGATIVGLFLCITIFYFIYKSSSWPEDIWLTTKSNQHIKEFLKGHGALTLKRYKFSDVKKMTNSFKFKLGQGGFGSVYEGTLPNGCSIAVKVLNASKGKGEDFINEVASISRTSHVNVVTLLGFCLGGRRKKALIYEFTSNGSLDKFIYQKGPEITTPSLSWDSLYQISLGIARGLEYLHRGCNTRILHFDIKPHNILLDENFCPKISDFGLAKLCPTKESIISMSDARGTIGYIAPELCNRHFGGVSHKSDVYSYGMLLLEMVGWRKNINAEASHSSETYFPDYIYKRLEARSDLGADGVVATKENEFERKMTVVGLWCIQTIPNDRPTISEVIDMLEGSMNSLEVPPKPVLFSPTRSVPLCSITSSSTT